ncbi:MAG: hypothetical protein ABFD86_05705 [Bryobacteraceae bacterium]
MTDRRAFLQASAAVAASVALPAQGMARVFVQPVSGTGFKRRLAEREMLRGLMKLGFLADLGPGTAADIRISFAIEAGGAAESYRIVRDGKGARLVAPNEQALLYAVFDFLERQGAFFGIDGESYPIDRAPTLELPAENQPWTSAPRFAVRGLLPWPDFLNCITVYNEEDFRAYFEAMLRMRFNTFGMHVYATEKQWAESYLSFEFGGVGHVCYLDTTATRRWSYLPQRTSRFGMGAGQFYDSEVFGSDSTRLARDTWEAADRARTLLRDAYSYAARLGIHTGIGFEPYRIPDEIFRALPPEVKIDKPVAGVRFDVESVTARKLLEARLAQLLEAYPQVSYVWLWEDEEMNWQSRKTGIPLSVTPFLQAHDFLRRHAPDKRLVVSGWGGVARHFEDFHKRLPGDVIFSCLSDSLGWDPVNEVFGNLEGRERWPIPWLEDDPGMWLTQLHVHRFNEDLKRAEDFGCQGFMGIHWRHRIVDITAGFQARGSWKATPTPEDYYRAYARSQASDSRAGKLAATLEDADRNRTILSSYAGKGPDGHVRTDAYSGDYSEAFEYWHDYEPSAEIVRSQKQVAGALRALADGATSAFEKERLEYITRHIEFQVPYAEAWMLAHKLHLILKEAEALKKDGKLAEARQKVLKQGVPAWLELAPQVRMAMLHFQRIVATRNDLGTLASKQNKFVRLALYRLRLSIQEYLGELPPEVERAFAETVRPDAAAPARLFLPTRPTMLSKGEKVRVNIIVIGGADPAGVVLHTRARNSKTWDAMPALLVGRRTYTATLGPFPPTAELVDYYVTAGGLSAPANAPTHLYTVTVT